MSIDRREFLGMTGTAAAGLATFGPGKAFAQGVLTFAAGATGSQNYRTGTTLAQLMSEVTGMETVVQSYGGVGSILPLLDSGEAQFGQIILEEGRDAFEGAGIYEGRALTNIRMVATLFPARPTLFVRQDSDVTELSEAAGLRIPWGFTTQPGIMKNISAMLAAAGLTIDDMQPVPVPTVGAAADAFLAGRVDVGFFALGAGRLIEVANSVGGVRYFSIPSDSGALERMNAVVPSAYITIVEPTPNNGLSEPTDLFTLDYVMLANADLDDDLVSTVTQALAEHLDMAAQANPKFREIVPEGLARQNGFEFHPGAVAYYQSKGLWPEG